VQINRPDTVAEVTEAFHRYEKALADGENDTLVAFFWSSPALVRFGLADEQHGIDELRAWRLDQPPTPPGRRLIDPEVTTFGTDAAVVTTRFDYPDGASPGRQSQTWIRTPDGWRIVSAHVSYPQPAVLTSSALTIRWGRPGGREGRSNRRR
jgi:hypothetical protein